MAKHSGDTNMVGEALRREQAMRLRWLRERKGATQQEAAEAAGITRDSWIRMESLGDRGSRIDAVALRRFCAHYGTPGEYVLSGDLIGLPKEIVQELLALERHAQALAAGHMERTEASEPSGTSRRKSTQSTAQPAGRAKEKA